MRCLTCDARNADGADWCTQCYASLGGATPPPAVEVSPPAVEVSTGHAPSRDVRAVGDEVEWRCARCRSWAPLAAEACPTCGAARTGFGDPVRRPGPGPRDRGRLVAASVLLPGLGHLLAGRVGTGVARMLLGLSWGAGGLAVVRGADAGGGILPAVPLLLGSIVVWAASVRDVAVLGEGTELLRPKVLAGLTVAVVGTLLVAALAVTTGGATGG